MKKIIFLTIAIICLIIITNLLKSIYDAYHTKDVLLSTQHQLTQVSQENKKLKAELREVSTQNFIEKEARDKLFLQKPGESIVILPSSAPAQATGGSSAVLPYWQQWWNLFF